MSDKPTSDLRHRMIADMTVRSFSDKTQHEYIRQIETFARFLGRSPDTASGDDIRRFQLAQVEQGAQPPKMNSQASALRFFLTITLGRADLAHQLARTHYPRKLPRVLAADQVARLIEAAPGPGLKYKAALSETGEEIVRLFDRATIAFALIVFTQSRTASFNSTKEKKQQQLAEHEARDDADRGLDLSLIPGTSNARRLGTTDP